MKLFGDFIDDKGILKDEFKISLINHPFMNFELANNAIKIYTTMVPGVVFKVINKVFGEELYENIPQLYPLAKLIDIGATNYYDVSGSLNLMEKRVFESENHAMVFKKLKTVYNSDKRVVQLHRGAVLAYEELK